MDIERYTGRNQTLTSNAERVSALVEMAAEGMTKANSTEKVPLSDMARVRSTAEAYVRSCSLIGTLPTVRGCASMMGLSRQALYDAAKQRPGSEFSKWLEDFSDMCGELTMQAAMEGTVAAVPAIFVAKSRYGFREEPTRLEIGRIDSITGSDTQEAAIEIATKYAELPAE